MQLFKQNWNPIKLILIQKLTKQRNNYNKNINWISKMLQKELKLRQKQSYVKKFK